MHLKDKRKIYLEPEQLLNISEELSNGVQIKTSVLFEKNKFLDNQKDIIQDFIAELLDKISVDLPDVENIKSEFESGLQGLNTKLKSFADKFTDAGFFPIKGYIQIVVDNLFMSSMIGNTTIVIFRDHRLYYTLHNGVNAQGKIDLFSDFVEGDIQAGDEIIYVGTKISDVIDQNDFKELESILKTEEVSLIDFIHEVVTSRLDKKHVGFVSHYMIKAMKAPVKSGISMDRFTNKFGDVNFLGKFKGLFVNNKYQATVGLLSLIIVFMLYNLLSDVLKTNSDMVYVTSEGVSVDLTVDDIKKDIFMFQSMDPTGDEKSLKYQDIMNKLSTLESKGRRLEDVVQLKKILKADYYKGFNIISVNNLSQFDDLSIGKKTRVFTINATEKQNIGDVLGMYYRKDLIVAGSKGSLVGTVSNDVRGTLVEYGLDDTVKGCNQSLLKDGLYCYTDNGKIILVNRGGIQMVTTSDPDGFTPNIAGLATYGKANLYVFEPNITSLSDSVLVTRYRNTLGSQTIYQQGQKYYLNANMLTGGLSFGSGFNSFAIDSTFLTWANGKLYQFWRSPATSFNLDYREVKLLGGDKMTSQYSDNVRIISTMNSKYVYFFDKTNQTFTIYESRPQKTNDQYTSSYNLYYMFRFSFDLGSSDKVLDVTIPESGGEKPEMFIMTTQGINKIRLYEFIDSIKQNNVLKQVNSN